MSSGFSSSSIFERVMALDTYRVSPKFLVNATPPTFLNRLLSTKCILAEGVSVHCRSIFAIEISVIGRAKNSTYMYLARPPQQHFIFSKMLKKTKVMWLYKMSCRISIYRPKSLDQ
jgi:hypothetical protein